jgi:hypothetical protein
MIIDPFSATVAGGQAIMGLVSGFQQQNQAAKEAAYNTAFQNAMTESANRQTERNFGRQLGMVQEQFGYNQDAANRAYAAEQIRLNELFSQAAFQQQGALQNLLEVQGANNASEQYGRSARRANLVNTLGQFGRNQAMQIEGLTSARSQSTRNLQQTSRDLFSANLNAWQQVAIAPSMQSQVPMPQASSGLNTALMIGGSLMSGLNTYAGLRAPSSNTVSNAPTRSSAPSFPSSMNTSSLTSWAYGPGLGTFKY